MAKDFEPPPGPPPKWRAPNDYQAPTGPPPNWQSRQNSGQPGPAPSSMPPHYNARTVDYAPPAGPPPGHHKSWSEDYAPPPGPPPGRSDKTEAAQGTSEEPPPYHDWTVIPDNALLPPPPTISNTFSPTANATEAEGAAAHQWCLANPLWQARPLPSAQTQAVRAHAHTLVQPQGFTGDAAPVRADDAIGRWRARSRPGTRDSCLQTSLPLYSALNDSPLQTECSKTIYFEVTLLSAGQAARFGRREPSSLEEADAGVALGFFAPPYPGWRLPGWQRGSLGVHGDDGRRYVNDPFGGLDFTEPFRFGETLGVGMVWKPQTSDAPPTYTEAGGRTQSSPIAVNVFFTRDGRAAGGWDLHEELDAEHSEGGTKGLDGECDVFAAVGVFGQVEVEVCFNPRDWKYSPPADRGGW